MPNYTRQYLATRADELGFVRDTLEKVYRLTDILEYLNRNLLLRESLALKGGTAINLTIFNLPRLSIDIDLDYAKPDSLPEMQVGRADVSQSILKHIGALGYSLGSKSKTTHSLDSWVLEYTNAGGNKDRIKLEINYSMRAHLFPLEARPIVTDAIESEFTVSSLSPMELYASKIAALINRTAARDLYDVHSMVHLGLFDESQFPLLRKSVVFYAVLSGSDVPTDFDAAAIDGLTHHRIRTELLPVLRRRETFNLDSSKAEVKRFIQRLMRLEEPEKEFLSSWRGRVYRPDLLFDDPEIVKRIEAHPMALWKAGMTS